MIYYLHALQSPAGFAQNTSARSAVRIVEVRHNLGLSSKARSILHALLVICACPFSSKLTKSTTITWTVDSLMIDREFHIGRFEQSDSIVQRMCFKNKTRGA